jgi:hypothetical protein
MNQTEIGGPQCFNDNFLIEKWHIFCMVCPRKGALFVVSMALLEKLEVGEGRGTLPQSLAPFLRPWCNSHDKNSSMFPS